MAIYNIVNLDNETCPLNCQNLKELLSQEKYIVVEIVESGNGWLIKIDDCYIDDFSVLAEGDFVLSGKFNNKPYCLVFEKSSSPFSEEQKFPSYNEECTDKVEAKILLSEIPSNATKQNLLEYFENFLPCGGKVQQIHIESESATITFFDKEVANRVASESPIFFRGKWIDIIKDTSDSEIQKNEVATKTVSVHGVPEDMNLDEPQSFFENGRRSGGGKIEKEAERDESTNVEITSASEEDKVEAKILLSEIPSNATKQNLLEYFENFLPCGGKVQQIHIESESATITFFDKEVANRVASKSPIFFRGKWIDIIKDTSDSEIQKNEVATKTVSVHGVPEDMNLDEPQSFFENGRRSGGGKIEKEAERDESTNVEITSASEEAKSKKPMLPARPSQAQKSQNNPEIVLGFLNKLKCNVIVNTTNNSLDLSSGAISKAILADAGPELQQECYRHSSITTYEIAVTSGYNLPCDNVFHISLPHWSQSSVNLIKTYVINCLLKADEMKLSHIAFPALGTGVLGYPIDMVANAMFSAVSEYMSGQNTVVQKITFVIYPKDTIIQKAFEDVKSNGSTISSTKTYQSHTEKAAAAFNNIPQVAAASNKISQDDSVSFDINGVTLILQTGSITDQNVDGIVHGTNAQFTSNGAISESLQSLIGHQFTKDCKSKIAEMVANNYAITKAHSLPATYIVHVNIEGIKTNATQIFKLCFDGAEKHQITSLALPPLGTGRLACSIQYFSKHLRNAVHDFAKSSPKNLKTVKIVIFQREMFGEFCREMKSIAKSTKSRILSSVKNFIFQKI